MLVGVKGMTVSLWCLLSSPLSPPPRPPHDSQVFDNTPAALDGTVAAGDEITGVNGRSIKGKTKVEVAKMIQEVKVRASEAPQAEKGGPRSLLRALKSGSHCSPLGFSCTRLVNMNYAPGLGLGLVPRIEGPCPRAPRGASG